MFKSLDQPLQFVEKNRLWSRSVVKKLKKMLNNPRQSVSVYDEKDKLVYVTLQESIFPFLNLIEKEGNLQIDIANVSVN